MNSKTHSSPNPKNSACLGCLPSALCPFFEDRFYHSHTIVTIAEKCWKVSCSLCLGFGRSFGYITIQLERASKSRLLFRSLRNVCVCQVPDPTFLHLEALATIYPAVDRVATSNGDFTNEQAAFPVDKIVSKDRVEKRVRWGLSMFVSSQKMQNEQSSNFVFACFRILHHSIVNQSCANEDTEHEHWEMEYLRGSPVILASTSATKNCELLTSWRSTYIAIVSILFHLLHNVRLVGNPTERCEGQRDRIETFLGNITVWIKLNPKMAPFLSLW